MVMPSKVLGVPLAAVVFWFAVTVPVVAVGVVVSQQVRELKKEVEVAKGVDELSTLEATPAAEIGPTGATGQTAEETPTKKVAPKPTVTE